MAPEIPPRFNPDHRFFSPTPDLIPVVEKIEKEQRIKCILLGDGAVGKTSLIVSYTTNGYPTEYVPTAFDDYSVRVEVDGQPVRLQLCDTAGQDDFDHMRPLCYPGTDVIMLCFSVVRPTSLCNVREKWLPEIQKYMGKVPIVLVGTQTDLRSNVDVLVDLARYSERPVTEEEAVKFAEAVGAVRYVECSSLTQKNLKNVFDAAILEALDFKEHGEKKRSRSWRRKKHHLFESKPTKENKKKKIRWWKHVFCFT